MYRCTKPTRDTIAANYPMNGSENVSGLIQNLHEYIHTYIYTFIHIFQPGKGSDICTREKPVGGGESDKLGVWD